MPYWGWILLVAGLSILALAIFAWTILLGHRSVPARQAAQGDPERDISAPLPMDVAKADDLGGSGDAMTAREIEEEREREARPRARNRTATYEIVLAGAPTRRPVDVVGDLPPAEVGQVLFYQGSFWRVNAVERATSQKADGRLVVSQTTDSPRPAAA
jgi:hypothetical protein